jgi:tetratricopeptide (TPR) repeat protein
MRHIRLKGINRNYGRTESSSSRPGYDYQPARRLSADGCAAIRGTTVSTREDHALPAPGGNPAGALADLDRSLELASDPAVFFNRGVIHQERQDWDLAAADFSNALALAPGDPDASERLSACRARLASGQA